MNVTQIRSAILSIAAMGMSVALPAVAAGQGGAEQATEAPAGFLEIIFSGGVIGILMIVVLLLSLIHI